VIAKTGNLQIRITILIFSHVKRKLISHDYDIIHLEKVRARSVKENVGSRERRRNRRSEESVKMRTFAVCSTSV